MEVIEGSNLRMLGYVDWRWRPALKGVHGGWKATHFIYGAQALESMASFSILINLVTYLVQVMHFSLADAANTVSAFSGTAFLLALLGGFIADTFIGPFWTILISAFITLKGELLLAAQAHFSKLKPPKCNPFEGQACQKAHGLQVAVFYLAIYVIAVGSSGLKPNLASHGADQLDEHDSQQRKLMSSFFNWIYFSIVAGILVAVTVIVWIQNNVGADLGYLLSAAAMAAFIITMAMGARSMRTKLPQGSPLTRVAKVFVAAFRKINMSLPSEKSMLYEVSEKESLRGGHPLLSHTAQFRFLDKAALMVSDEEGNSKGNEWSLCTVTQVEEVKCVLRMLPIFATTICLNIILLQLATFSVEEGATMDGHLGKHFKITAVNVGAIPVVLILFLSPIYEKGFVPMMRRITGHAAGITSLQRVGVGLFLSTISMLIAALVESKRKEVARAHNLIHNPVGEVPMSVLWLIPQIFAFSLAEMFTYSGLLEFFYSQSPPGMRALSSSLTFFSSACGSFLSTALVSIVNKVTKSGPYNKGWLSGYNLNENNLNYFYFLVSVLSFLNFLVYIQCARWYRYKQVNHPEDITSEKMDLPLT